MNATGMQLFSLLAVVAFCVYMIVFFEPSTITQYDVTCWDRGETVIDERVPYVNVRSQRGDYTLIVDFKGNKRHFYNVSCDIREVKVSRE